LALAAAVGCGGGTLDAGKDDHGLLPVDARNPVIIDNDGWSENWVGEYALLLANSGGPQVVGIIANSTAYWPNANANASGWLDLVTAARTSGLRNVPDVTRSNGAPLVRPPGGDIERTTANDAAGARLIVSLSRQMGTPGRPVVVLAGAPLTNLADAYLLDNTVVERVVVVASLGQYAAPNGVMNGPNGDLDPWAAWIVAQRFRYVHVATWYDQTGDVTQADLASLPQNPLGARMADKHPDLFDVTTASDQIGVLAVGLPSFVAAVQRASPDTSAGFDGVQGPALVPDAAGSAWVVTQIQARLASARLWQMLLDPRTFGS
jgi:hypothetical protein